MAYLVLMVVFVVVILAVQFYCYSTTYAKRQVNRPAETCISSALPSSVTE